MKAEQFDSDIDFEACLEMGRKMHAAGEFSVMRYSEDKVAELFIEAALGFPFFFVVVRDNGKAIAMMLAYATEHFFSDDIYSDDLLVWVEKSHLRTGAGMALLDAYREWATKHNITLTMIGSSINVDQDAAMEFFCKGGFRMVGTNHIMTERWR